MRHLIPAAINYLSGEKYTSERDPLLAKFMTRAINLTATAVDVYALMAAANGHYESAMSFAICAETTRNLYNFITDDKPFFGESDKSLEKRVEKGDEK